MKHFECSKMHQNSPTCILHCIWQSSFLSARYDLCPTTPFLQNRLIKIGDINSTPAVLALISLHVAEINRMVGSYDILDV